MKYRFKHIDSGQIAEGYLVLDIVAGQAEIDPARADLVALAEKNGGVIAGEFEVEATLTLTPTPEFVAALIDLSDGVDDAEARTAGKALSRRRNK